MKLKTTIIFVISLIAISCKSLPPEFQKLEGLNVFKVSNDKQSIVLDGVINSSAFKDFKKLTDEHPNIKVLEIVNCDGSINDYVNLELANYVYQQGFNTHLNVNGLIASGGTDLFLAGRKRSLGKNIRIGVHSWGDGKDIQATDFPKEHKYHKPYIEYYQSVGFTPKEAEDFYFFTINSAPANDVHWMTVKEIKKYKMINTNSPVVVYENTPIEYSNDIPKSLSKDIIGKWKLEALSIGEDTVLRKDAMGTAEVFQNYEINNKFTSIIGKQSDKGTWEVSKEEKSILIHSSGIKTAFRIVYFKKDFMALVVNQDGQEIILNYKKVTLK